MRTFILITILGLGAFAACGKKSEQSGPPPEVTGLAAVPASAEGIIGADVGKLANSPIVERAVEQLLARETDLAASWKQVREGCKIDFLKQVKRILLVLGPVPEGGRVGTGPALMVATGAIISEADLSECVAKLVGKGGGSVTGKPIGAHTLYSVKDGARAMYFAFGRSDTVVLGNNEQYVIEALGAGKKAPDHPELGAWLRLVDQNAPLWAVGRLDARVSKGLVGPVKGLSAGPTAVFTTVDPTEGAKVSFGAVMASAADAKQLESWLNVERIGIAMAAQKWCLQTIVAKVAIQSSDNVVSFKAPLEMADVNQLLSVLDGKPCTAQDSAPQGSGSGSAK